MPPKFEYSPHPSFAYHESMLKNLEAKTGSSLAEWLQRMAGARAQTPQEQSAWLKSQGLSLNYARIIQQAARGEGAPEDYQPDCLVNGIFAGHKSALLPTYEAILEFSQSLPKPARVCPCQTIIPFYRQHVFAQVKVPNKRQLHLGLALGNLPVTPPLEDTGGFAKKDRISHRIVIASGADFDDISKHWFREAWARDR